MSEQPTLTPKEAKAKARADRAYRKASRPFVLRHKILTGLSALVALIVVIVVVNSSSGKAPLTGEQATTSGPTHSSHAAVGTTLTVTADQGVRAAVTVNSVSAHKTGSGAIAQPPAHGQYDVVNVTIRDTSGTYAFNPLYFKLLTPSGQSYDMFSGNAVSAGFDPSLDAGNLTPGTQTGGNVTFDVPVIQHGSVQLTDPLGTVVGTWTF